MEQILKLISQLLKLSRQFLKESLFYAGKKISYRRAKMLANNKYESDGKTYYVIEGRRWTYFVGNSLQIDILKRKRVFKKDLNINELLKISAYKVGRCYPPEKVFTWKEKIIYLLIILTVVTISILAKYVWN